MPDRSGDQQNSKPSAPGAAKVCFGCKGDCSNKARVKDPAGHYWCKECFDKADAMEKNKQPAAPVKAAAAAAVIDDAPIVFTSDEIGGARACISCKSPIDAGVVFCTLCGADQNAPVQAAAGAPKRSGPLQVRKQPKAVRAARTKSMRIVNAGEFAGLWRRFAAHLLDGVLLGLVVGVPTLLFTGASRFDDQLAGSTASGANPSRLTAQIIFTLTWIAYGTLLEGFTGATLGKRALGLIVGTTESGEIGLFGSLVRNCCKIFVSGGMFSLGALIGGAIAGAAGMTGPGLLMTGAIASLVVGLSPWLLSVVTTKRQTLHDLMSGAVVVG